ncbi:MAG: SDR family oxidoreductase [Psychroflexus sp.]|jgi:NAD(P)-dependent dehydrogenase (short-subunit alcohol dehydrogenase family)|nr:SDR family oxidoreductase [Psychroflexus sp.]
MNFKGKKVLITGGSRGIGKATAMAFAEHGAHVGINYKNQTDEAEKTLALLEGNHHQLYPCDISDQNAIKKMVADFVADHGQLDVLVNNAGISIDHDIEEANLDEWSSAFQDTMATNFFAASNLSFLAAMAMMQTGGGHIVNVSSRGAFRGEPTKPAYGASKAALNSLTQSMAKRLAPHKIYVAAVAPGFTETDMATKTLTPNERENLLRESPFKRMAQPDEIAHAILFLASDKSAYSSGTIIDVNGASYLR